MKFNFRKIASALASTAMIGSTVALAAAANYPAPFVSGGSADVAIVYGNSLDLAAVTDISTSLSSALASSGSAPGTSSEAYGLFTGSTPLQLNNSINSVRTSITDANLPLALADSDFSGNVDADIVFQIIPGSNPRVIFAKEPTSSDDPGIGVLLSTTAGNYLYNATSTFSRAVNFSHVDSEGESISLFGKAFTVASASDVDTLVLFQSAETLSLSVGGANSVPSQVVTVSEETYTIELTAATDTSATIKVTDSSGNSDSKKIDTAASKKILGLEVAVNLADESTATNTLSAEVIVGANKLTLEDGTEVTLGSDNEPIDGTKVDFNDGQAGNLTKLTVQVFASEGDEDFIQSGDEFVDPVFGGFRFFLSGLANNDAADRESIEIDASGTDKMTISMTNWQGKSISNFVFVNNESNSWGSSYLGDTNDYQIFVTEMAQINESAYAVVGNEDEGYLVKLKTLTNSSGTPIYTNDKVVFENVFDSTQSWDATITAEGTGTIDIGGKSYTVTYRDNGADNVEGDQNVRLNDQSTTSDTVAMFNTIETEKGAKFAFYEPTVVVLSNYDGLGSNVSSFSLPDGDGYTSVAVSPPNQTGNGNYSINSVNINTSNAGGASSTLVTIGSLQYNFSSAGSNATTEAAKIRIRLQDGVVPITRPGIVLFEEKDEGNVYNAMIVQTSGAGSSSSGTGVSDIDFTWDGDTDMGTGTTAWGAAGVQLESNEDLYQMMDQWGTLVTTDEADTDQFTTVISYPGEQVSALLYVDSVASGSGSTTLGDVKLMDDELSGSTSATKNLIVVGGSCVNTAASSLLSNAGCGSSWTAATSASSGDWIIQTFASPWGSNKVATLVAGWEQSNTADAATYLTTQNPITTVGHKLTGTTGTAATVVTA